jgi:hypothetical protein
MASEKDPTVVLAARFISRLKMDLRNANGVKATEIQVLIDNTTRSACELAPFAGQISGHHAEDLLISALPLCSNMTAYLTVKGVNQALAWGDLDLFKTALARGINPGRGLLELIARTYTDPAWRTYILELAAIHPLVDRQFMHLWITDSMLMIPDASLAAEMLRIQVASLPKDDLQEIMKQACRFKTDRGFLCLNLSGAVFGLNRATTGRTSFSHWVTEQMKSGHGRLRIERIFGCPEDIIGMNLAIFRQKCADIANPLAAEVPT